MKPELKQALDQAFPIEAELAISQSVIKQVGRSEILANDNSFLKKFLTLIEDTNYMRITVMPEDLKVALQLLLCERTYLIQLLKGLIFRILPKDKPRIFNDPFLEMEFSKLHKKRDLTPQLNQYLEPPAIPAQKINFLSPKNTGHSTGKQRPPIG